MKQLIVLMLAFSLFAVEGNSEADSLQQELDKITQRLEKLEQVKLEKRRLELENELKSRGALNSAKQNDKDTIIVADTIVVDQEKQEEKNRAELVLIEINKRLSKMGQKGFGGAGGPSIGLGIFSMKPVKDMIKSDIALRNSSSPYYGLDFENKIKGTYENFLMVGGHGLGGLGNGVRIGGAGYGGSRTYKSAISNNDSIQELEVNIGYGGVILEKAWSMERSTLAVGTFIGAGGLSTKLRSMEYIDFHSDFSESNGIENATSFFATDLHVAFTISLTAWFHVGVETYGLLMATSNGFDNGAGGGFATFNGGGRLRVLFGNLS